MKIPPQSKTLDLFFIILSALGLLFSLFAISSLWVIKPKIQNSLEVSINSIDNTLLITEDSLIVLDSVILDSIDNLVIIKTTLDNLDTTIENISASLDTSATLIGDDLRLTVIETQVALSSAASSAELIDNTLEILARITFSAIDYQPDVPLHISLEQVAGSLDDFPDSLESIEQTLGDTAEGLDQLNSDISELSGNISNFEDDLIDTQEILLEYGIIIDNVQDRINNFRQRLALYLTLASLIVTGFFFWLGLAQADILLQRLAYLRGEEQVVNLADINREEQKNLD